MPAPEQHYVVAIGGSAGSLDPLTTFFDHTPLDNASYIIIRHMPKNYETQLKAILKRHSKLSIVKAEKGMPIEKNNVYVSDADDHLVIRDNKFHFISRTVGPNRSIDEFCTHSQNKILVIRQ
jgi:chemotaxis response regulator CheB